MINIGDIVEFYQFDNKQLLVYHISIETTEALAIDLISGKQFYSRDFKVWHEIYEAIVNIIMGTKFWMSII